MGIAWRIDDCMNSVDPFDLSKALDGAAKAHLDPSGITIYLGCGI